MRGEAEERRPETGGDAAAALRAVLRVVSRSRDDEGPVFEAILETAMTLCGTPFAAIFLADATRSEVRIAASRGVEPEVVRRSREAPFPVDPARVETTRAISHGEVVHVADFADSELYRGGDEIRRLGVDEAGMRTVLAVPLLREGEAFGFILVYRREVRPFAASEIALLEAFAEQAVVAVDNARQFRALQDRLAQETATREVLEVISGSRDDERPVFEAILDRAQALCDAPIAGLVLAEPGDACQRLAAQRGVAPDTVAMFESGRMPMDGALSYAARCILEGRPIRFADMGTSGLYREGSPVVRAMVDESGVRSVLFVPLMRRGVAAGCITLFKGRDVVEPFDDRQAALVETFAAQAVIAVENVRQFRELETRLEREAATREILQVISRSRDDEGPVFDVILENASRLCRAPLAFLTLADEARREVLIPAQRGTRPEFRRILEDFREPIDRSELVAVRPVSEGRVIRLDDMKDSDLYRAGEPRRLQMVDVEGVRSVMGVPLLRDGVGIGGLILYRREVAPFSDDDVALVQAFAAQAVIAIENVRQFRALEARTKEVQALNASLETRVAEQVAEIERMGRLKRFLSPAVADAVVSSGDERLLSSHRALVAVLFADIRGFTAFCETAEPEETIEVLQTYHEAMGALLGAHGVGVDHRSGDGIMAIFNDPLPCEDPAGDAVRLALAMREGMEALCRGWRRLGHRLGFGVGVSLGYATVGLVGSEGRYDYTASGTTVNLAARLCDEAEDGEILLSPRAFAAVEEDFETEARGAIAFKGIQAPVEVRRLIGARAAG